MASKFFPLGDEDIPDEPEDAAEASRDGQDTG